MDFKKVTQVDLDIKVVSICIQLKIANYTILYVLLLSLCNCKSRTASLESCHETLHMHSVVRRSCCKITLQTAFEYISTGATKTVSVELQDVGKGHTFDSVQVVQGRLFWTTQLEAHSYLSWRALFGPSFFACFVSFSSDACSSLSVIVSGCDLFGQC